MTVTYVYAYANLWWKCGHISTETLAYTLAFFRDIFMFKSLFRVLIELGIDLGVTIQIHFTNIYCLMYSNDCINTLNIHT